jgi:hypothetical protein
MKIPAMFTGFTSGIEARRGTLFRYYTRNDLNG